jgi:hypothetical protein
MGAPAYAVRGTCARGNTRAMGTQRLTTAPTTYWNATSAKLRSLRLCN